MGTDTPYDWYWLAFRHPEHRERKEGKSAIGVCIVEAAGPNHALARSKQLGINPGGEMKMWRVPAPPPKYRERLLRPEEAKELNLVMKEVA